MNKNLMENNFLEFKSKNTYSTMNFLSSKTKTIWIVCHGFGQLSKHFIRRFDVLDKEYNFIVAPEGISKFYLHNKYDLVGASWITKENIEIDIYNQKKYFDSLFTFLFDRINLSNYKINLLGFSQGVNVVLRLLSYKKVEFNKLILWAGGFPNELNKSDYLFLKKNSIKIFLVIGNKDEFYNEDNLKSYNLKIKDVFDKNPIQIIFKGKHEVKREIIKLIDEKY